MKYAYVFLFIVIAIGILTSCSEPPQEVDEKNSDETGPTGQVVVDDQAMTDDIGIIFAEDTGTILPPPIPTT